MEMADPQNEIVRLEHRARGCVPLLASLVALALGGIALALGAEMIRGNGPRDSGPFLILWIVFLVGIGLPVGLFGIWAWIRGYAWRVELRDSVLYWSSPWHQGELSYDDIERVDAYVGDNGPDSARIITKTGDSVQLPMSGLSAARLCKEIRTRQPQICVTCDQHPACKICGAVPRYVVYVRSGRMAPAPNGENSPWDQAGTYCSRHAPPPSDDLQRVKL
jgi:hypothetical protein